MHFFSFLALLLAFPSSFCFPKNNHLCYHSLIHPHLPGSLAASSGESRFLVLSRLSLPFVIYFTSLFFLETHLLQRFLLFLYHKKPSLLSQPDLISLDWSPAG